MLAYPLVRLSASSSCCCSTPDSTPAHTLLDHLTETCTLVVSARPGASEQRETAAVRADSDVDLIDSVSGLVLVHVRSERLDEALELVEELVALISDRVNLDSDEMGRLAILEAYLAAGRIGDAITYGTEALRIHSAAGQRAVEMRLRIPLGHAYAAAGEHARAREHWLAVLPHAQEQQLPELGMIEALLKQTSIVS